MITLSLAGSGILLRAFRHLRTGLCRLVRDADGTQASRWWVQATRVDGSASLADDGPLPAVTRRFTLDGWDRYGEYRHDGPDENGPGYREEDVEEVNGYIDGQAVHSIADGTVAYQSMYVLANLAVGGDFPYRPVDEAALPARLKIDWIRVYQERETD